MYQAHLGTFKKRLVLGVVFRPESQNRLTPRSDI